MKKLFGMMALMMILAILFAPMPSAQAQVPVDRTFTIGLTASSGSTNYTTGIHNPSFSSFKPLVLDILLYATNATVSLKRSATGNAYYTYAMGTSTSTVQFVTNDFYWLRGDTIYVGIGATNIAGTVKVQGLEQ